jgi:hypothetical protein
MPDLDETLLRELIDLTYDHACTRPVGELVDVARVMTALDAITEPERATRWQMRVLVPMRERVLARAAKSEITLSEWLPEEITEALRERLGRPRPIPRTWIDEAVANERVRDAVRAMLNEALTSFVQKVSTTLTENKAASSGGLRGVIGLGARAAGSVLGGIGEELQQRMQDRVKDYVDIAVGNVQKRIAERLASEETARAIGRRRLKLFERALKTTEAEATRGAHKNPWADLDAAGPRVVAHNLARPSLREAIEAELRATFDALASETLGTVLDDAGMRGIVRDALHQHALPGLRDLVRTPGFEAWWARATAPSVGAS